MTEEEAAKLEYNELVVCREYDGHLLYGRVIRNRKLISLPSGDQEIHIEARWSSRPDFIERVDHSFTSSRYIGHCHKMSRLETILCSP